MDIKVSVDPIALAAEHWANHGWAEAAGGMALVTSVMRVQQLLLARVESVLRPSGLTFARFEVLRLLAFTRTGTLPIGKVGERLQVHAASVTNAVSRLEADALVERSPNRADGRGVLVTVSPAGRRRVEACTGLLNNEVFTRMPMPDDEQWAVFEALRSMRRAFGDFADDAPV